MCREAYEEGTCEPSGPAGAACETGELTLVDG